MLGILMKSNVEIFSSNRKNKLIARSSHVFRNSRIARLQLSLFTKFQNKFSSKDFKMEKVISSSSYSTLLNIAHGTVLAAFFSMRSRYATYII